MSRKAGSKTKIELVETIDEFKKMSRAKASSVAHLFDMQPRYLSLCCLRGEVPGAKPLGRIWYVTPLGMDLLFEGKKRNRK